MMGGLSQPTGFSKRRAMAGAARERCLGLSPKKAPPNPGGSVGGNKSMMRIVAALAVVSLAAAGPAMAQTKAKAPARASAPAYKAPRGPDGKHPDLNGVWQVMNSANWDIEPHAARM